MLLAALSPAQAVLGGNANPSEADIKKILASGERANAQRSARERCMQRFRCHAISHAAACGAARLAAGVDIAWVAAIDAIAAVPKLPASRQWLHTIVRRTNTLPSPNLPCAACSAVGVEAESERIQKLLSELEGKDLQAVMAEGKGKLAAMPAAGPAVASAGPAAGGAAPAAKKEEKKEEKPESDEVGVHAY